MGSNEKERPVISGLDEIFAANEAPAPNASETAGRPQGGEPQNSVRADGETSDRHSSDKGTGNGQRRQGRPSERGRRRNRRQKDAWEARAQDDVGAALNEADTYQDAPYDDISSEAQDTVSHIQSCSVGENETIGAPEDTAHDAAEGTGDTETDTEYTEVTLTTSAPESVEVVGVRFKDTSKTYYFAPGDAVFKQGDHVIVETSRGTEYGSISVANTQVPVSAIVPPLRDVLRLATDEDTSKHEENVAKAKDAFGICLGKIRDHGLEMKLIDAEYTFDQSKLTFYFSADGRVDFRDLVKDLASVFRTRIELRQIGIRDEAKLVGGLGVCGRPFCCSTFLSDFVQVSIKMAKEQNLSLNSAKISGACGRLMCCLRYEHDTYAEEIKKTPSVGSRVKTADGVGVVIESAPLRARVKVRIGDETNNSIHEYDRGDVTVIPKNRTDD